MEKGKTHNTPPQLYETDDIPSPNPTHLFLAELRRYIVRDRWHANETEQLLRAHENIPLSFHSRSLVCVVVCVWMRGMRGEGRELRG